MQNTPDLDDALARANRALNKVRKTFVIIGGMAVIINGYERFTIDVDLMALDLDPDLDEVVATLASEGLEIRAGDIDFVKKYRVLRLVTPDGTGVDVSLGILPFEEEIAQRANRHGFPNGINVLVASAEDLIIMKLIASRHRDIDDCRRLLELHPEVNRNRITEIVGQWIELVDNPEKILANLTQIIG